MHVATGFLGRQGGLGRDRDFSIAIESCWPRVATGKATSRHGWNWDLAVWVATEVCWPCVAIDFRVRLRRDRDGIGT